MYKEIQYILLFVSLESQAAVWHRAGAGCCVCALYHKERYGYIYEKRTDSGRYRYADGFSE